MDPLPDWFEKMFRERKDVAAERVVTTRSTEELWEAKGRLAAFIDIANEIDIVKAQAAEHDREAAERFTRTDA